MFIITTCQLSPMRHDTPYSWKWMYKDQWAHGHTARNSTRSACHHALAEIPHFFKLWSGMSLGLEFMCNTWIAEVCYTRKEIVVLQVRWERDLFIHCGPCRSCQHQKYKWLLYMSRRFSYQLRCVNLSALTYDVNALYMLADWLFLSINNSSEAGMTND